MFHGQCANVGRAVTGMPPNESVIAPLVLKLELYEMSPPPRNIGGAVSGAAPCPFASGTQSKAARNSNTPFPQRLRSEIRIIKTFPSRGDVLGAHVSVSRNCKIGFLKSGTILVTWFNLRYTLNPAFVPRPCDLLLRGVTFDFEFLVVVLNDIFSLERGTRELVR
jgi:hypothetical protein